MKKIIEMITTIILFLKSLNNLEESKGNHNINISGDNCTNNTIYQDNSNNFKIVNNNDLYISYDKQYNLSNEGYDIIFILGAMFIFINKYKSMLLQISYYLLIITFFINLYIFFKKNKKYNILFIFLPLIMLIAEQKINIISLIVTNYITLLLLFCIQISIFFDFQNELIEKMKKIWYLPLVFLLINYIVFFSL